MVSADRRISWIPGGSYGHWPNVHVGEFVAIFYGGDVPLMLRP